MSSIISIKATGYAGGSFPNEGSLFLRRKHQADGVAPGIICLHGRSGDSTQYTPWFSKANIGYFSHLLALAGYRVLAIDDMGGTDWGAQASSDRISNAYTYLTGTLGAKAGRVGIMGWSMGGVAALNWMDQNAANWACAWLWAPATDLNWAHSQAAWTAEIETAYSATSANWATQSAGNNPVATPANYRGAGPIKLCHAQDDATIPYSQSQTFVTNVNDPNVTLRTVATGGHTGLFTDVTDTELLQFYKNVLPVS